MSTVEEPSVAKFVMPKPRLHQVVAHYQHAEKAGHPHPAMVVEVFDESLRLMSLSPGNFGADMGAVRHVDDPFLKENDNPRRWFGGWDFTEHDKETERRAKVQAERISALERRVEGLSNRLEGEAKARK